MDEIEKCAAALETLAWHEAAIAEFYRICGTTFEEQGEVWTKLAEEEARHSALLLAAKDLIKGAESTPFQTEAVNLELVESSTKFVRREIERLKGRAGYSIDDALSAALKIENSFFDHNVFEAFRESPVIKLRETAMTLSSETGAHAKALDKLVRDLKRKRDGETSV